MEYVHMLLGVSTDISSQYEEFWLIDTSFLSSLRRSDSYHMYFLSTFPKPD